jgi:hypothetical protein
MFHEVDEGLKAANQAMRNNLSREQDSRTPPRERLWASDRQFGSYPVMPAKSHFYEQVTGVKCFLSFSS